MVTWKVRKGMFRHRWSPDRLSRHAICGALYAASIYVGNEIREDLNLTRKGGSNEKLLIKDTVCFA